MNKKPIIAVTPLYDNNTQCFWMLPAFFNCIKKAGGIPVMLSLSYDYTNIKQFLNIFDGFLFTGGDDINPHLYFEEPESICGKPNDERDQFERDLFGSVIEYDKPALGICRGLQLFNVLLGGTLYQDLATQHHSIINHQQLPPYDIAAHQVYLMSDTPLYDLLQVSYLNVNSYHHQAIKNLAAELIVMAKANDGLIEAIYRPKSRFLWVVQWHLEYNYLVEPSSQKLMEYFVKYCSSNDKL